MGLFSQTNGSEQMTRSQAVFFVVVFSTLSGVIFYIGGVLLGELTPSIIGYLVFLTLNYPYVGYVVSGDTSFIESG